MVMSVSVYLSFSLSVCVSEFLKSNFRTHYLSPNNQIQLKFGSVSATAKYKELIVHNYMYSKVIKDFLWMNYMSKFPVLNFSRLSLFYST